MRNVKVTSTGVGGGTRACNFGVGEGAYGAGNRTTSDDTAFIVEQSIRSQPHRAASEYLRRVRTSDTGFTHAAVVNISVSITITHAAYDPLIQTIAHIKGVSIGVFYYFCKSGIDSIINSVVALVRALPLKLVSRLATHNHFFGAKVLVDIVDRARANVGTTQCFYRGAEVIECGGLACRVLISIETATNGHITAAKQDSVFTIIDGVSPNIQTVACGNHWGYAVFSRIGERSRTNGNMITINFTSAEVIEGLGFENGLCAIDSAAVS